MPTKLYSCHILSLFLGIAAAQHVLAANKPALVGEAAPPFQLKDQFDHEIRLENLKGSLVVIVCGDRRGGDYMNDWAKAVSDNYKDSPDAITIVRVANLFAVPPFFRSYAKQRFLAGNAEGKPAKPTLLDWDAVVPALYGFTENLTNVYVIDAQGVLRYKTSGKGTPDEIRALIHALEDIRSQAAITSVTEGKQP
jgi:AhpC/TSA family